MTDWDLLTPGIGLTSIGITGVGISLSGIAKTFIDGMHAVSLLTMFIGMIFLASGLFKDGFPSSGRAKSATFITLGFLVTFGVAAAVTVSTQVPSIFAYIGLMMIIGIPAAVLAFVSFRKPQYLKATAIIFIAAAAVSGITFYAFGLVTPKAPTEQGSTPAANTTTTATPAQPKNIVKASILAGASSKENPSFAPNPAVVAKGDGIEWTNNDNTLHTVTHKTAAASDKPLFNSGPIKPGGTFLLNTATLSEGDYQYFCTLHPFMTGSISVKPAGAAPAPAAGGNQTSSGNKTSTGSTNATAPAAAAGGSASGSTVTAVSIAVGASTPTNGKFFSPDKVETKVGSMVSWTNDDSTFHTVTSGKVENGTPAPDKLFDSSIIKSKGTFSYVFEKAGEYGYYCSLHPYMTGKVTVS